MKNGSGRSFEYADSATLVQISWCERATTRSLTGDGRLTGIGTSAATGKFSAAPAFGSVLSPRSGDAPAGASATDAGALPSAFDADNCCDGISSALAAPASVIKQIQAGRNRCRIVSPNC